MQLHTFWLYLILKSFNAIESKSLNSVSKVCAPEEQVVTEGKCWRYVNDLMYLTEEYPPAKITLAIAKNMSSACDKITSCFGEIECAEARKNQEVYERKCETVDFHIYDMRECTRKFYEAVYNKSKCTIDYDFFSKDLKIRRDAYTKGKSCVISIAKEAKCGQKSLEYLNLNYEKFVDLMSVKLDQNKCTSLHDELIAMQCGPAQSKVESKVSEIVGNFYRSQFISTKPIMTLDDDICEEIQTCVQGMCLSDGHPIEEFSKSCDELKLFPFYLCEARVKTSTFLLSNSCENSAETRLNSTLLTDYWDDKKCMRILMGEQCGNDVMNTFDRDWENYHRIIDNNASAALINSRFISK